MKHIIALAIVSLGLATTARAEVSLTMVDGRPVVTMLPPTPVPAYVAPMPVYQGADNSREVESLRQGDMQQAADDAAALNTWNNRK